MRFRTSENLRGIFYYEKNTFRFAVARTAFACHLCWRSLRRTLQTRREKNFVKNCRRDTAYVVHSFNRFLHRTSGGSRLDCKSCLCRMSCMRHYHNDFCKKNHALRRLTILFFEKKSRQKKIRLLFCKNFIKRKQRWFFISVFLFRYVWKEKQAKETSVIVLYKFYKKENRGDFSSLFFVSLCLKRKAGKRNFIYRFVQTL